MPAPAGVELVETPTAADLEREALAHAAEADVVVMAAAVADYRPAEALAAKRPKDTATWTLELEPTIDVLSALGERRHDGQILVGFAAETGEAGLERAREKLARKGADLFVLNDVSRVGHRLRRPRQRGDAPRGIRRATGCESTEGGDSRGNPRRGGETDPEWLSAP